ncbi:beta strand repeat-containing protein, partial [Shinella sp. BYT-45]|uniref:beta strand repeat-containing protein n=1 Tax=Shinella sp. BYT-45 TaxID=3377377 RepID=UPI00397F676B
MASIKNDGGCRQSSASAVHRRSRLAAGVSGLALLAGVGVAPAWAQSVDVTSASDSGPGTLRSAVETANGNPAIDTVRSILPAGATITLSSGPVAVGSSITLDAEAPLTIANVPDIPNRAALHLSGGNRLTITAPATISTSFNYDFADLVANPVGGIVIGDGGNVLDISGRVQSSGGRRPAMISLGDGNTIRLRSGGAISSTGSYTFGILSQGADARIVVEQDAGITAQSLYGTGISFSGAGTHIDIAGDLVTTGQAARGIAGDVDASDAVVDVSGRIDLQYSGLASPSHTGISIGGDRAVVTVLGTGEIVTHDHTTASAIYLSGDDATAIVAGALRAGQGRAVRLTGSGGRLELRPGYAITGGVEGNGAAMLTLGGVGNASFDLAALGGQFTGFAALDKRDGSTWTLTGAGTGFAGPVTIDGGTLLVDGAIAGSAVTVNAGGTLGGSGEVGSVVVADDGILAPGSSIGTLTVAGDLTLNQASQLRYEIGTPGGAVDPAGGSSDRVAVGGNLTLDGQLHLTDAGGAGIGHYRLMTYAGSLADNTLDVVAPGPVAGTYTVMAGAGNVDLVIAGGGTDPVIGDPSLQYWQDSSPTWDAAGTDWRNSGGSVDVAWAGNHGVFQGPGGTVAIEGTQSFRGLQFVSDGYVLAGPGALQTVAGGSELRVLAGETATIAAAITGAGGISKTEGGTLILSGANTYAGATAIDGGVLRAGAANTFSAGSAHVVAAGAVLDLAGYDQTVGSLAGEGSVLLGSAALTAGGDNTSTTFSGVMEGSGGLTKTGAGILTLTGENTYTGLTTIDQGNLYLGDGGAGGSVAGNIHNDNAFLVFNRSDDFTYAGVLSGTGSTAFVGTGMTTLTGDSSSLTGRAIVTAGNLRIGAGGSFGTSLLSVDAEGVLSGLGTVTGDVSLTGGTLAPGADALGTLAVQGNVAFDADSAFAVRIAADGTNDALAATTASLNGNVTVAAIDPHTSYVDRQTYTILTTTPNGLSGTFDGATMLTHSAFLTPTLTHNADNVELTIAMTTDFAAVAETYNQAQAARALNDFEQTGDALTVFNAVAGLNADDARRAFDQVSGEVQASGRHVIDETFALFNRTLRHQGVAGVGSGNAGAQVFTAPLGYGPAMSAGNAGLAAIDDASGYADARVRGAWLAPLGGFGQVDGDANAARLDWWSAGLAGGYEGVIDVGSGNAAG